MKKIKYLLLIVVCVFVGLLNVAAAKINKTGSNYGASLYNINEGLKNNVKQLLTDDQICFFKTRQYSKSLDDDYVVILFTKNSTTGNKYMPVDITGEYETSKYTRSNTTDYFIVNASGFTEKKGNYGGTKWWKAKTSTQYFVYNGSSSISSLCSGLAIAFIDNTMQLVDRKDVASDTMYSALYTSMGSTSKYEYSDGSSISESDVKNTLSGASRVNEEDVKGCDINMNTSGTSVFRANLEKNASYGWILNGGNQHICFAETDGMNSFVWKKEDASNFYDTFQCTDYCVAPKFDSNVPFCNGYYIKKSSGKCENVSSEIATSSHSLGSQVTNYIEYNNASAASISVFNENNTITVEQGSNQLSVSNLSNYSSIFQNKETGKYPKYLVQSGDKYSFTDQKPESFDKIYMNVQFLSGIQGLGEAEIYKTCEEIFGESLLKWLDEKVFMIIRIGVPILLILLTTFDFAKVVFNDDKDGMQNAFKRFRRRAIAAVLIFLTPSIIMLIGNLVGVDSEVLDCPAVLENMHETSN